MSNRRQYFPVPLSKLDRIIRQEYPLIPRDAVFEGYYLSARDGSWCALVRHDSFDDIGDSGPIPIWEPPPTNSTVTTGGVPNSVTVEWNGTLYRGWKVLTPGLGPMPEKPSPKKKWREFL